MSSKKKKRSCPFSSSKPRAKKRKKAFNSEVATELASSDKGSFYNQDEWLEEIASHEPDTSESVEISASRLKIRLEDTEIKKIVTGLHDSRCTQKCTLIFAFRSCYCLGSFVLQDLFQVYEYLPSRDKIRNFP